MAPTPGKTPARRVVVAGDTAEDKAYDRLVEQDMTTRATGKDGFVGRTALLG